MRQSAIFVLLVLSSLLTQAMAQSEPKHQMLQAPQTTNTWFVQGERQVQSRLSFWQMQPAKARNIILFVGDGMSLSTLTSARILEGQQQGSAGEEHQSVVDRLPLSALVKTYNVNAQVPDSAGTMSAMMTGLKTNAGVISVSEQVQRGDCETQHSEKPLTTLLELAELKGKATGIVSTTRLTHATPAAAYGRAADRDWEHDGMLSSAARKYGCIDLAQQLVDFLPRMRKRWPEATYLDGLDVVLGGGRDAFVANDYKRPGAREDGQNLIKRWQQRFPKGQVLYSSSDLDQLDSPIQGPLFGLFADSHMSYELDRDAKAQPSLAQMTQTALSALTPHPNGFVLIVEAGRIDHGHHANNASRALYDTLALFEAIEIAQNEMDEQTLLLVTADHSHSMTMSGYSKRGNPILGKASQSKGNFERAADGLPYTTLGYMNGPSSRTPRRDLSKVDTEAPGFLQPALVPLESETHGGEDVVLYSNRLGWPMVTGTFEQHEIFHIMRRALGSKSPSIAP